MAMMVPGCLYIHLAARHVQAKAGLRLKYLACLVEECLTPLHKRPSPPALIYNYRCDIVPHFLRAVFVDCLYCGMHVTLHSKVIGEVSSACHSDPYLAFSTACNTLRQLIRD